LRLAYLLSLGLVMAAQSASDLNRVAVGAKPPAFELPSAGGGTVSLASLEGKNVVLVFYRGYW
jgi:cytochrome oxidase Cu insertion factor (SCO1/SenC/PrrC family)